MTREDLFKALGNAEDKYINEIAGYMSSNRAVLSDAAYSSAVSSSGERTIVMNVVRKKKGTIGILVAAVLLAGTVAATAVFMGTRKDNKEYKEKKIENYFKTTDTVLSDNIVTVNDLSAGTDCCYYSVYSSGGEEVPFAFLYNIKDGSTGDIDLNGIDGTPAQIYAGRNTYYLSMYNENSDGKLLIIDSGLNITGSIKLEKNMWLSDVRENEDNTFTVSEYTLTDNEISAMYAVVFDAELNEISRKTITDANVLKEGTNFNGYMTNSEGCYCVFYQGANGNMDMYGYDTEGNLLCRKDDIISGMPGVYMNMFMSAADNPVVFSSELRSDGKRLLCFNEYDLKTGELLQMYESENDMFGTGFLNILNDSVTSDGYDFRFEVSGRIYGYCLDSDEITEIFNTENCPDSRVQYISNAELKDDIFIADGCDMSQSKSGIYICRSDTECNITESYRIENASQIRRIRECENGNVMFLYDLNSNGRLQFCIGRAADNKIISTVKIKEDIYSEDFLSDSDGNIALSVLNGIMFFDSEGNLVKKLNADCQGPPGFFRVGNLYYAVYSKQNGSSEIRRLDLKNGSVSEVVSRLDFNIENIYDGIDGFDAVFRFSNGLYGYSLGDNSIREIINWLDSDIYADQLMCSAAVNSDLVISVRLGTEDSEMISVHRRVSDEELLKIQERPVLNVAVSNMNDGISKAVKKYNSQNEEIRIHIEDYSKYEGTNLENFTKLNEDVITGDVPDIIITSQDFDLMRFSKCGFLEDMSKYLDSDSDFEKKDYFENILNAYSVNGKQYGIPLSFHINALFGKKTDEFDNDNLDYEKFFSIAEEKNLFSYESRESLKSLLITDRINEFCNMYSGKCSFESDEFIKLLEIVKKYGLSDDVLSDIASADDYYEKSCYGIAGDICVFKTGNELGTDDFALQKQKYHNYNVCWYGLPSEKGGEYYSSSNIMAAVFKSSEYKQEAWNFVKFLLSDDVQKDISTIGVNDFKNFIPVNRLAFEQLKDKENGIAHYTVDIDQKSILIRNMNETESKELTDMISSITSASMTDEKIRKIIDEQTDIFFAEGQTAEETAKNIQKKVSVYLKEIK